MQIQYKGKFVVLKHGKKVILVVGDLHLGFESALNNAGAFINRYIFDETKQDLEEILNTEKQFSEIVLLGDIKHTFGSILREEREQFKNILAILEKKCKKIVITKGNHDVLLDYLAADSQIEIKDMHIIGEVVLLHGDKDYELLKNKKIHTIIIGHIHPAIILRDGVKAEKYKCFLEGTYKGKQFIIVPSIVSNTEGTDPRNFSTKLPWKLPLENFKVIAVGKGLENYKFGKLKDISLH